VVSNQIDFIIPWVDGGDPLWLAQKNKYTINNKIMNTDDHFKDWENLQYLFRGIEQFAPWVNKIYFITWGHLPKWLNINHPKLTIVKHEDFLDKNNLPVFNINAIETNLHRIKGLSEQFVFFNDDTFLTQPISPEVFFQNNLPVNVAISDIMHEGVIAHIIVNDIDIINRNFNRYKGEKLSKKKRMLKYFSKWFNIKYGLHLLPTLLLWRWGFTGFINYHHPQPFLKQTFKDVWEKEPEVLRKTSASKFRDSNNVNQYLFKYWQFVTGKFMPDSYTNAYKKRKYVNIRIKEDAIMVANDIKSNKFQMYCVNDCTSKSRYTKEDMSSEDFEFCKKIIIEAFETILPQKSQFELD